MADTIADSLNTLFESELFEENNFIKIYNLLGINNNVGKLQIPPQAPVAAPPTPTPTPAPPAPTPVLEKNGKFQNISYSNIQITFNDNTISQHIIPIFKDLYITNTDKYNILKTILNEDILDNIDENDVILDPAGLPFMQQKTFRGAGGLSKQIYDVKLSNCDIPEDIQKFYHNKLYGDLYDIDKLTPFVNVSIYNNYSVSNIKIIHSIGPDFNLESKIYQKKYNTPELLLALFTDIYNDIMRTFLNEKITNQQPQLKLKLCVLSGYLFGAIYKDLIYQCVAYVYIKLWKIHKDYIKLYIYELGVNVQYIYYYIRTIINNIAIYDDINDTKFSIVTANLKMQTTSELVNALINNKPSIICTQETNGEFIINDYIYKKTNGNTTSERINVYIKDDLKDEIDITKNKELTDTDCLTRRTDLIINTKYKESIIKIGIVHLCGGKNDDIDLSVILKSLSDDQQHKNKLESLQDKEKESYIESIKIDKIKEMKVRQLQKMIEQKVDIILGDFNSDIEYYLGHTKNTDYLTKTLQLNEKMIEVFNTTQFQYLKDNGYELVCGNNKDSLIFYIPHTSIFKSSPDAIYYKTNKFRVNDYKIIDLLTTTLSDHNGIYAEFTILK